MKKYHISEAFFRESTDPLKEELRPSKNPIEIIIPVKLQSFANTSYHWTQLHHRRSCLKKTIALFLVPYMDSIHLPISITLIRLGSRKLDYDNLVAAFKPVRDQIAYMIFPGSRMGQKDSDPRITWHYDQAKGASGIKIIFENNEKAPTLT